MKYACTHEATYKEVGIDYKSNLVETLQQKQIEALKAQVNYLREVLDGLAKLGNGELYGSSIGNSIAARALEFTPEQCLAEVKAKAIEDACADLKKELERLDSYALADSATITDQAKRIKYLEMVVSMCHTMDTVEDIPILETYTAPIALKYSLETDFNAPEEINLWYGVDND